MEKDIQKLTQNERYDLKRKQLKEEWNKMTKEITQEDIIKNYREVNAEQDYKIRMLEAENQRLKEQLKDYENVLKDYADGDFYEADINLQTNPLTNKEEVFSVDIQDKKGNVIYTKAQETLKKWEE